MLKNNSDSIYELTQKLLENWSLNEVSQHYQDMLLSVIDAMDEIRASQCITQQIDKIKKKRSPDQKIQNINKKRQSILSKIKQKCSAIVDSQDLNTLCRDLFNLRQANLKLSLQLISLNQQLSILLTGGNKPAELSKYYRKILKQIDQQQQFIKQSQLDQYIEFSDSFDPFFMYQYELMKKDPGLIVRQEIDNLYQFSIPQTYQFIKTKKKLLGLMEPHQKNKNININPNKIQKRSLPSKSPLKTVFPQIVSKKNSSRVPQIINDASSEQTKVKSKSNIHRINHLPKLSSNSQHINDAMLQTRRVQDGQQFIMLRPRRKNFSQQISHTQRKLSKNKIQRKFNCLTETGEDVDSPNVDNNRKIYNFSSNRKLKLKPLRHLSNLNQSHNDYRSSQPQQSQQQQFIYLNKKRNQSRIPPTKHHRTQKQQFKEHKFSFSHDRAPHNNQKNIQSSQRPKYLHKYNPNISKIDRINSYNDQPQSSQQVLQSRQQYQSKIQQQNSLNLAARDNQYSQNNKNKTPRQNNNVSLQKINPSKSLNNNDQEGLKKDSEQKIYQMIKQDKNKRPKLKKAKMSKSPKNEVIQPSDNKVQRSKKEVIQPSDNKVQRSKNEVIQPSDNKVQRPNKVQRSKKEVIQPSDNKVQRSKNEVIQPSDNKVQRPNKVQKSKNEVIQPSDNKVQRSKNEVIQPSDNKVQRPNKVQKSKNEVIQPSDNKVQRPNKVQKSKNEVIQPSDNKVQRPNQVYGPKNEQPQLSKNRQKIKQNHKPIKLKIRSMKPEQKTDKNNWKYKKQYQSEQQKKQKSIKIQQNQNNGRKQSNLKQQKKQNTQNKNVIKLKSIKRTEKNDNKLQQAQHKNKQQQKMYKQQTKNKTLKIDQYDKNDEYKQIQAKNNKTQPQKMNVIKPSHQFNNYQNNIKDQYNIQNSKIQQNISNQLVTNNKDTQQNQKIMSNSQNKQSSQIKENTQTPNVKENSQIKDDSQIKENSQIQENTQTPNVKENSQIKDNSQIKQYIDNTDNKNAIENQQIKEDEQEKIDDQQQRKKLQNFNSQMISTVNPTDVHRISNEKQQQNNPVQQIKSDGLQNSKIKQNKQDQLKQENNAIVDNKDKQEPKDIQKQIQGQNTKEKYVIKLSPKKNAQVQQVYEILSKTQSKQEFFQAFQCGSPSFSKQLINNNCYIAQFYVNSQVSLIVITRAKSDDNYEILLWLPVNKFHKPKVYTQMLKNYRNFLIKYTHLDYITLYISKNSSKQVQQCIERAQFIRLECDKPQKLYYMYQNPKTQQDKQNNIFLNIEMSVVTIRQHNSQQDLFYSEQIQLFSQQGSYLDPKISQCQKKPSKNQQIIKNIQNLQKLNEFLTQKGFDDYPYEENKGISNIYLNLFQSNQKFDKNGFFTEQFYFCTKFVTFKGKNSQVICKADLQHQNYLLFFIKGPSILKDAIKFANDTIYDKEITWKKQYAAIKFFTKSLYGRIKGMSQKFTQKKFCCYGNWDINLAWKEQLQGKIHHNIDRVEKFGPQKFYFMVYTQNSLSYAYQINQSDFIQL